MDDLNRLESLPHVLFIGRLAYFLNSVEKRTTTAKCGCSTLEVWSSFLSSKKHEVIRRKLGRKKDRLFEVETNLNTVTSLCAFSDSFLTILKKTAKVVRKIRGLDQFWHATPL